MIICEIKRLKVLRFMIVYLFYAADINPQHNLQLFV